MSDLKMLTMGADRLTVRGSAVDDLRATLHGERLLRAGGRAGGRGLGAGTGAAGVGAMHANVPSITQESPRVVRASYSGTFARLVAAKHRYDPDNFFRRNLNISPGGA